MEKEIQDKFIKIEKTLDFILEHLGLEVLTEDEKDIGLKQQDNKIIK